MLRNMLVVLLLVFEAAVTGVAKIGILWFFLVFLLWITKGSAVAGLILTTLLQSRS